MSLFSLADKPHGLSAPAVMASVLQVHPDVRRLTAGWLLLALTALALSTLCAVLLIAARTPSLGALVGWGELFGRALALAGSGLLGLRVLWQLKRTGRAVWAAPLAPALLLSVLLFLLGCALGAMIRNDSTMVPAHYHGTVGAVTLAYMALGYRLQSTFSAQTSTGSLQRWQPVLYGVGLMVLALALSTGDGAGTLVDKATDPRVDAIGRVAEKRKQELDQRFVQGVALLNNRQNESAASELHRVLELAPQMPQAHVNMGLAMIGVQHYPMARDFFNSVIELNSLQLKAHDGLAGALEGLKDIPSALGAMRSYVRLSKPDDTYLAKANAAIGEWEAELQAAREGARP